jgi:hypothetical protein
MYFETGKCLEIRRKTICDCAVRYYYGVSNTNEIGLRAITDLYLQCLHEKDEN